MNMRRRTSMLVGMVAVAALSGCGDDGRVATAQAAAPPPAPAAQIASQAGGPDGVENFRPGEPVLVADQFDTSRRGYVAWDDLNPPPGTPPEHLVPVRNAAGEQIAVWGVDIGWIDLDEANAPGFTYEAAHAAEMARVDRSG